MSVWDDGYGISVPITQETTKASISDVLRGFMPDDRPGIDIYVVRGWDYPALIETYAKAIDKVRRGAKAGLVPLCQRGASPAFSPQDKYEGEKKEVRAVIRRA